MPRYAYTALDASRKRTRGTLTAESQYAARKHLRTRGLHPTNLKEVTNEGGGSLFSFGRSGRGEITGFTRELATMLNAGIKLTDALSVLTQQVNSIQLRNALGDIRDRVVTGESLADSMAEYPHYFNIVYISMVRVGELTGTLHSSLSTMASFREKRAKVESKMKTAMIYPVVLLTIASGVVLFLTYWLIPKVAKQIEDSGQELPGLTKAIMKFTETTLSWWGVLMLAVLIGILWAAGVFFSTPKGAYMKDMFFLKLPVFGSILRQRIVARFASTLSTLMGAGMSVADSLRVVAEVTGNTIMNRAVLQARDRILSGADIATPLRESGVIDPSIAHMVAVGEKSGELEMMLRTISESLESSSDVVVERLMAVVEPLIIVALAGIIATIALAAFLPLFRLSMGI